MKKAVVFIISVLTSLVFIFWLSSCGSSASTKLGMSKEEVKALYDEAPTYEYNNTLYWGDDDFKNLLKKYDYELGDDPVSNYQIIVEAMGNTEFKAELNNLSFRFRFARFEKENNEDKLIEFYYDFTHKFDLEDDYSSSLDKQVKEINLSKSRLDYYITEAGQWKNNKNKVIFKAELVDFDNISYTIEFEDGTIYKGYLKNSLVDATLDEFVLNKNSKKYEMFLYVNTEMNNANFNDLTDEISTKISFALSGKCLSDEYKIDLLENSQGLFSGLFNGRCVGYIGGPLTKDGKYTIYKWNTKVSYLPDSADINSFTGQMTQKIWKNVIYEGYTLNPYYKVVGVQDPNKPSYEIEDGAVIIGENAFSNLSLCYKIEIPETVVEVERNAIVNDINLVSISIPASVEEFDSTNLNNCPKLLEIVSGSNCVTENMFRYAFQNGAGFFRDFEDYRKNGFACILDGDNKFIVAEIKGSNTYFNDYNYDGIYIVGTIKLTSNITMPETLRFRGKTINNYKIFKYAFATNTTINIVNLSKSVTEIREQAFYGCKNLETITANSVTNIDTEAFKGCTNLKNISFDSVITIGHRAFEGCVKLTNLEFNKVQSIDYYAFMNCTGLIDVELPNVNYIYSYAFMNCTNLETFNAPKLSNVYYSTFENCYKLANLTTGKLNYIEDNAFKNCEKLKTISITDNDYLNINDTAFDGSGIIFYKEDGISYLSSENNKYAYLYSVDSNKESVVIKNDVLCVRVQAFYNLTKLKSLTVQDNIEFHNLSNLLYACPNLTYRESNGAKYIGSNSNPYLGLVSYDKTLSTCNINSNTKYIMNNAFEDSIISSISFPTGLEYVGSEAFKNCDYIRNVTLPQISFEYAAFSNCDALEEVSLYCTAYSLFINCTNLVTVNNLTTLYSIYDDAFNGCSSLETIDLSNCSYIGYNAFKNCSSLSTIDLTNTSTICSNAFEGCRNLTTISLPNIYELYSYAFKNCAYLENVELGENLAYIGDGVFEGCSRLKDLVLPDRVVNIGYGIVNNCSKLAKISIPKEVFGYITNALGNVVNAVDVYVKNSYEELEELGFKLSYLELNQRLYIYSETEPEDGPTTLKYWHYDTNGKIAIWA